MVRDRGRPVKVGSRQRTALDPERLDRVESGVVELLEALVVRHENVPLDDRNGLVRRELVSDGLVEEELVELNGWPLRIDVLLRVRFIDFCLFVVLVVSFSFLGG